MEKINRHVAVTMVYHTYMYECMYVCMYVYSFKIYYYDNNKKNIKKKLCL